MRWKDYTASSGTEKLSSSFGLETQSIIQNKALGRDGGPPKFLVSSERGFSVFLVYSDVQAMRSEKKKKPLGTGNVRWIR